MKVFLYDTTLRDGNQDRKISLSLADKLQIARILDHFGFDYIEGGWPNPSNPTDEEFFQKIKEVKLKHAKIAAFGSTRRPKVLPEKDPLLQALVKSGAPVKTIFGKSWDLHVTDVIRTTLEENLDMIESSVDYLKDHSEEVIYDAEHFFDGYKANPQYALETLKAAERGRADFIVLCDTNGGTMPWELEKIVKDVKKVVSTPIGIHVHNDAGLGVCNSLFAVKSGATMVQGVVNGYGERCGNANLTTIAADLHFKMGAKFFAAKKIARLRQLSSNVDQIVNLPSDVHAPYVGDAAFAHKGGAQTRTKSATTACSSRATRRAVPSSWKSSRPSSRASTRRTRWWASSSRSSRNARTPAGTLTVPRRASSCSCTATWAWCRSRSRCWATA